jgi:hypothetical protein
VRKSRTTLDRLVIAECTGSILSGRLIGRLLKCALQAPALTYESAIDAAEPPGEFGAHDWNSLLLPIRNLRSGNKRPRNPDPKGARGTAIAAGQDIVKVRVAKAKRLFRARRFQ